LLVVADATEAQASKPKREKKEAFKIDFTSAIDKPLKEMSKELFAPVTRGAGINLPRKNRKATSTDRDLHLLPDDMHFSSRQLVTLFLKPKFSVRRPCSSCC
jgi:condensin complex subunit 2